MRRLSGYLLATLVTLTVLVALIVSGLRLALPHLERFRPQIVEKIEQYSGVPMKIGSLDASWQSFGPTLDVRDISLAQPKGNIRIQRVTVALDVWQSLLHWRWQFRDLTFYHLNANSNEPFSRSSSGSDGVESDTLTNIFLYQFDHFILRDSKVTFPSPSGTRIQLNIPNLTWLNTATRHRAEGQVMFSTQEGQHGNLQVRMDLHDKNGLLSDGQVYLQADEIEMKPWLSRWVNRNTGLHSAKFSLASWLTVTDGEIQGGHLVLKQGEANWSTADKQHDLTVDNLNLQVGRVAGGWTFDIPQLNLATDGVAWPKGSLSAMYRPENTRFIGPDQPEELRLRATDLQLERIGPILPTLAFLTPDAIGRWDDIRPKGHISYAGVDIPLQQPERSRFIGAWQDVSWQAWKLLPGVNHFNGSVSGSAMNAGLHFSLKDSVLPYGDMFRAPLEVSHASGYTSFINNDKGWSLSGDNLDIQAKSLWATGEFKYQSPTEGQPWLSILSGIRLYDAAQAWRYFPEPLMGTHLVDYLTGALEGGKVDNATLVYAGNPHYFPYQHNEGQFQVFVPLRDATFRFQPEWAPLSNLAIDLNFLNDGLWMDAPHTKLGDVDGTDITAVIPVYHKEKLLVDAKVSGSGKAVHEYFKTSPLADSVGAALDELEVGGNVSGRLHLDIPLDGKATRASGDVTFKNNALLIKPLDSTFTQLNGSLHFDNGNLTSSPMNASWFGQPVNFTFSTAEGEQDFGVDVALNADWQPAKLPWMPTALAKDVSGSAPWNTKVAIKLPHKGHPSYDVQVNADLKNVSSHLPSPLDKARGEALPLVVNAKGDLNGFMLSGSLGPKNHFNSQLILQKHGVKLARAAWSDNSRKVPALPESESLTLNLPALDGEEWLAALAPALSDKSKTSGSSFSYPQVVNLSTPQLILAGQIWHQLTVSASKLANGTHISAKGREINGVADLDNNNVLRANLAYLYYNPEWSTATSAPSEAPQVPSTVKKISFSQWPSMILRCQDCWMMGQRLRQVNADLTPRGDQLVLSNGLINTGNTQLTLTGTWNQSGDKDHTTLKGRLKGANVTNSSDYFGFASPLKNSPFDIHFDVNWMGEPWSPQVNSLNGTLSSKLGKGEIDNAGGGRAGQLLRLVSFDALLRKLKLDFSDTFGQGFYYDSIRGNGKFKNGILSTNDLLVDGLAADIAMDGSVNFVTRRIDMQAVVAPEISATVGVATAFVINPVVGAAVFAASKVLAPLWNKISLIRYNITGSLDHPTINEVLRQPKEK